MPFFTLVGIEVLHDVVLSAGELEIVNEALAVELPAPAIFLEEEFPDEIERCLLQSTSGEQGRLGVGRGGENHEGE